MLNIFKKDLRTNQTDAENILWYRLRARRFQGLKFRRQHILEGYIVDFMCLEKKLITELDGGNMQIKRHTTTVGSRLLR